MICAVRYSLRLEIKASVNSKSRLPDVVRPSHVQPLGLPFWRVLRLKFNALRQIERDSRNSWLDCAVTEDSVAANPERRGALNSRRNSRNCDFVPVVVHGCHRTNKKRISPRWKPYNVGEVGFLGDCRNVDIHTNQQIDVRQIF